MKFNIEDYRNGKYVMRCHTIEEAISFCNYLDSLGRHWSSGKSYSSTTNWSEYHDKTCYNFIENVYADYIYYDYLGYTILEWSDFMYDSFKKSDLRSGDVILLRNGVVEIICTEVNACISKEGCDDMCSIRDDLRDVRCKDGEEHEYDIVAVRRPKSPSQCRFDAFDADLGELVYKREGVSLHPSDTSDNASDVKVASNRYFYLPFSSGDIVHYTDDKSGTIEEKRITKVTIIHDEDYTSIEFLCNNAFMFCAEDIGESIFASRAEAKKHLNRN